MFFVFTSTMIVYASTITENNVLNQPSDFYLINSTLKSNEDVKLVPITSVLGKGDVHYVTFQYELLVKEDLMLNAQVLNLSFSNNNITEEELQKIFNFDITMQTVNEQTNIFHEENYQKIIVNVQVSMNEPDTVELMNKLINENLSFEMYFYVISK